MKSLHYDAMALGNHEFDNGVDTFVDHFMKNLTENGTTDFPILAANIDAKDEPRLDGLFGSTTTFNFGNVKIGVIGYITEETVDISGEFIICKCVSIV